MYCLLTIETFLLQNGATSLETSQARPNHLPLPFPYLLSQDLVTNRDARIQAQIYQMKEKEIKKAGQADIDKAESRLSKDLMMEASSARTKRDQGAAMVAAASAGEGAFSSEGKVLANIGNLRDMVSESEDEGVPKEGDDKDINPSPAKSQSGSGGGGGGSEPDSSRPSKKAKRPVWFDRDAAIAAASKSHNAWLKATHAALVSTRDSLRDTLQKVAADVEDDVKNEARLCKGRLYAVRLVLGEAVSSDDPAAEAAEVPVGDADSAEKKPAVDGKPADSGGVVDGQQPQKSESVPEGQNGKVAEGQAGQAAAAASAPKPAPSTLAAFVQSAGDAQKALRKYIASFSTEEKKPLGNAPPCRSYQALILFSDFEEKMGIIEACETKDDIANIQSEMKTFKTAYSDLLSMSKAAQKRLATAIADAVKQNLKKKDDAVAAAAPKKGRGRPKKGESAASPSLQENAHEIAFDIPSVPFMSGGKPSKDLAGVNYQAPIIFRAAQDQIESLAVIKKSTLSSLESKFKADPARTESGRSQRSLPPEQGALIMGFAKACFPDGMLLPAEKISDKLRTDTQNPTAFVVAKNWVTASAEGGHMATCRMGFLGNRVVVCAQTLPLLKHLSKSGGSNCELARVYQWLKTATAQAAKAFVDAYEGQQVLMHATVGPADMLFLPPGWTFYEKIGGSANFLGVRVQMLSVSFLPVLRELNAHLLGLGKPNPALQSLVDCLTLAEA